MHVFMALTIIITTRQWVCGSIFCRHTRGLGVKNESGFFIWILTQDLAHDSKARWFMRNNRLSAYEAI